MFARDVVLWILLSYFAILLPDESMGTCDGQAVQRCVQGYSAPEVITSESLQAYCHISEVALACIGNTGCLDIPNIRAIHEGLSNAFNDICGTLKAEYLPHANCYESSEVKDAEILCSQQEGNNTDARFTECDKKSRVIKCLVSSVNACCGSKAAQPYAKLMRTLFSPVTESIECQLRSDVEVDASLVCVSTTGLEYTKIRLEYTTSQLNSGMRSHNNINRLCCLAFIAVSLHIRQLFQTFN